MRAVIEIALLILITVACTVVVASAPHHPNIVAIAAR